MIDKIEDEAVRQSAIANIMRSKRLQAEREEQRKAAEAYQARLREHCKAQEEYTAEWFCRQMMSRVKKKEIVKITHHKDRVEDLLGKAYEYRVAADNQQMEHSETLQEIISGAARWMTSPGTKPGIILRGLPGVGKSTLMRAITDVFFIFEKKATMEVSAMEVARADERRMKEMVEAPMLAIDDMGVEPATIKSYGNEISPMVDLITQRHKKLLFTIITTNLVERRVVQDKIDGVAFNNTDEIKERYGIRVYDRLQELCNEIKWGGELKSYRGRKSK